MSLLPRTLILGLGFVAGTLTISHAAPTYVETLVHDTTTPVQIKLDDSTVLCSSADYGALFLKVGIPQLAALTLLDHQNIGAGAPCVAAGVCEPGHLPEDIIDAAYPDETVAINVKAVRVDERDAEAETCTTSLVERVHVTIRGFDFTHERWAPLGSRPFTDCAAPAPAEAPGDTKTDAAAEQDAAASAGCAATGGAGGPVSLALVGLVAGLRRRRR